MDSRSTRPRSQACSSQIRCTNPANPAQGSGASRACSAASAYSAIFSTSAAATSFSRVGNRRYSVAMPTRPGRRSPQAAPPAPARRRRPWPPPGSRRGCGRHRRAARVRLQVPGLSSAHGRRSGGAPPEPASIWRDLPAPAIGGSHGNQPGRRGSAPSGTLTTGWKPSWSRSTPASLSSLLREQVVDRPGALASRVPGRDLRPVPGRQPERDRSRPAGRRSAPSGTPGTPGARRPRRRTPCTRTRSRWSGWSPSTRTSGPGST